MKTLYFFLCLNFISIISVNAQTVLKTEQINLKNESKETLSKVVKEYDLLMLNPEQIRNECSGGNCKIVLKTPNQSFLLTLEENQLFSANYTLALNGRPDLTDQKIKTFKGYIGDNKENFVRLTISNDFFGGYLNIADEVIQIRPLNHLLPNNEMRNAFILFKNSDVIYKSSLLDCDYSELDTLEIKAIEGVNKSSSTGCKIIEIITEADYEFYQIRGYSTTAANSSIVSVLNQVEGVYNSYFNIQLMITHQNVWTSSNDPYTSSTSSTIISEVKSQWDPNTLGRDVVYLFTGKSNTSSRGRARAIGDICKSSNVRGTYAFTASGYAYINEGITTTHEIGHLFNAIHLGNTCTTLMCTLSSLNDYRTYTFASSTISRINSWISSNGSCLTDLESVSVTGSDLICTTESYSVQGLPSGSTVTTWTSDNSNLSMSYSTATRLNNYSGEATVTAFGTLGGVSGCNYTADKVVWVGNPKITNQKIDGGTYYHGYQICPGNHYVNVTPIGTGASNANWTVQSGVPYYVSGNELDFTLYSSISSISISANSSNTCGTSSNANFYLSKKTYGCSYYYYSYSPNPVSDEITVEAVNPAASEESLLSQTTEEISFEVALYNSNQQMIRKKTSKDNIAKVNVKGFKKGTYFLHIIDSDQIIKEQIIIE
jgi:hypothetical protein